MGPIYYKICIDSYEIYLLECFTSPLIVIGLPVKRGRFSQLTAFHLQSRELKIRTMLGWFVSCDVATKASRLGSEAIDVAEVERDS